MLIKIAIIGMGKMGRIRKRELDFHPGFEVVAICDINESVGAEYPKLYFSTKWEDILEFDIDAVVVCTYNNVIANIVCKALEKGLHVFAEKPPGKSVSDVEKMIETEKKAKDCILKFGFNHRFHHAVIEAKELIDSGRFGKILWARGIYGKAGGLEFERSWRSDKELSGRGILLDQGIHMLDLLRYFMGDFVEVKSFVENCYWKNIPMEDNAFAIMRTRDNQVAMLHSSATQWRHKFLLELFMEDGYITINGLITSTRSYGEESITFARKQFENEANAFGRPREETIYFDKDDSWKFEVDEFYNCIIDKKQAYMGTSKDAFAVMKLIENIYQKG